MVWVCNPEAPTGSAAGSAGTSGATRRTLVDALAALLIIVALAALLIIVALTAPAAAQQTGKPLYHTKVYFPATKSYFELVRAKPGDGARARELSEIDWSTAVLRASQRSFNGTPGRLAIVRSPAVHRFLMETFRLDTPAWIGLRYWCAYNKLQWIDGKFHDRSDWANWDLVWNKSGAQRGPELRERACGRRDTFWPVHYWPMREGFRWNANGTGKAFYSYFVEYPTGGR